MLYFGFVFYIILVCSIDWISRALIIHKIIQYCYFHDWRWENEWFHFITQAITYSDLSFLIYRDVPSFFQKFHKLSSLPFNFLGWYHDLLFDFYFLLSSHFYHLLQWKLSSSFFNELWITSRYSAHLLEVSVMRCWTENSQFLIVDDSTEEIDKSK